MKMNALELTQTEEWIRLGKSIDEKITQDILAMGKGMYPENPGWLSDGVKNGIWLYATKIVTLGLDYVEFNVGVFPTQTTVKMLNKVSDYFDLGLNFYRQNKTVYVKTAFGLTLPFLPDKKIRFPLENGYRIPEFKTGVGNANNPEWIWEECDKGIDLDWLEYKRQNPGDKYGDYYESCESDVLMGDWKKNRYGEYYPDVNGEYSALYRGSGNTYQVVFSRFYRANLRFCSPCYPDQYDIDSTYGSGYSFDLPPDVYGDDYPELDQIRSFYVE